MMSSTARENLINDYKFEADTAIKMKSAGQSMISASVSGPKLANGRQTVSIDEYIAMWKDGIFALENGADLEDYEY